MKILLNESFKEWQQIINHSEWKQKILICCGHKPTAISIATLFAIDPGSKADYLIGVCTSQSECLELMQQSLNPLLIFISGRLDDGSGISLVNAIHDQALTTSGEDHITVLTLNTVNPLSLKEALDSSANIILTHRGFETFTIHHVLHSIKNNINYIECPVMGGPGQAEEGILGGIVGGSDENFKLSEPYLKMFCKDYFYFGPVGMGAKSKLLNNFLSLGNAALVNHLAKTATELGLDLQKVFDVAKLGSGNSAGLIRIFESLLKGDFKGFKFTATNSVKDLSYIQDLLKDFPEAEKVAEVNKNYFQKAVDDGYGESFISELIDKK